jgi:GNAT superfamily N-acetyltransferase
MNARPATQADVPLLLDMIRDFFAAERIPFDESKLRPALATLLQDSSLGAVWLFEAENAPAGYAIVTYGFDLEFNGRDAILTDLFLLPAWRGRGAGKTAMHILEREAKAAGVHALHLLVDRKNERALRLYESARFVPSHRAFMTKRLD